MTLWATSCSNDSELLSTVPADASGVAVINLTELAEKSGFTIEDGTLKAPESMGERSFDSATMQRLAKVAEAIDTKHIVMFDASSGSPIVTFTVTDGGKLEDALDEDYAKSSDGGFTIYTAGADALLVRGNQGWMFRSTRPAETVTRILAEAKTESLMKFTALTEFLDSDGAVRGVVDLSQFSKELKGRWGCFNAKVDGSTLAAEIQIMSAEGKVTELDALQPLSTDFLRYLPAEANFALAFGATKHLDWDGLVMNAAMISGTRVSGMFDTLLPFLKKTDGTVAFATCVDPMDLEHAAQKFLVMVHMPQADADAAVAEVRNRFTSLGASATTAEGGVTVLNAGGQKFYLGNIDGNLALSSWPLTPTAENSLNKYFLNRRGGAVIILPSLGRMLNGTDFGVTFDVEVQTSMITATLSLDGTDTPILPALMSFLP